MKEKNKLLLTKNMSLIFHLKKKKKKKKKKKIKKKKKKKKKKDNFKAYWCTEYKTWKNANRKTIKRKI